MPVADFEPVASGRQPLKRVGGAWWPLDGLSCRSPGSAAAVRYVVLRDDQYVRASPLITVLLPSFFARMLEPFLGSHGYFRGRSAIRRIDRRTYDGCVVRVDQYLSAEHHKRSLPFRLTLVLASRRRILRYRQVASSMNADRFGWLVSAGIACRSSYDMQKLL